MSVLNAPLPFFEFIEQLARSAMLIANALNDLPGYLPEGMVDCCECPTVWPSGGCP